MSLLRRRPLQWSEAAIWQDVEFGSYAADLPLWEELAAEAGGPVLELGAGSGRVTLALARAGVPVTAIELDRELVGELEQRAAGLPVTAIAGDITRLHEFLPAIPAFRLAIAPLQVMQLLDEAGRRRLLAGLAEGLAGGGRCAVALVDESTLVEADEQASVRPDMRERDGWIYSSEPLWVQLSDETLRMRRLRERVAPAGDMVRRVHDDVLHRLTPKRLQDEAGEAGLRPSGHREIESRAGEAGSVVVILEAP